MTKADQNKAEQAAQERTERSLTELREGAYRFASKARGQAQLIVEELIDPDGEPVRTLADSEGDTGALALAMPLEVITFETWLFGQIGDKDQLDLDHSPHWELWFNFGAWIGETMRRRHGGHWLFPDKDPRTWRLGFSKIMLEIAPHRFAEQLLSMGQGAGRNLVGELERLREQHAERKKADGGKEIDRFTAAYYVRMHTMPLGQWMVMDFDQVGRLWSRAACKDLIKEVKRQRKKLGGNEGIVDQVLETLAKVDPSKPLGGQTGDRGLFEAVAQIVGMRRASTPIAMDVLEKMVIPAMHVGIPERFPDLDAEDFAKLRDGEEYIVVFLDIIPHKYPADDEGFLGAIPHAQLSTPYGDRTELEIGKGDWVLVDHKPFKEMFLEFDSHRFMTKYDDFVKYVRANPKAPRRRDDGKLVAENVVHALADFKACVVAASKDGLSLLFRMLPPAP